MQQQSIDYAGAERRASSGISRSAEHAERECPGWVDLAVKALASYARVMAPHLFTIEQARLSIASLIPKPTEARSWGQVTKTAKKRRIIEAVPGETRPAASSNGSPKQAYRAGEGAL